MRLLAPLLVPLLAPVVLTAGLASSTSPATAATSCRGVPATIEASGVQRIDGTEGDDVIVADDVIAISALGGDDLVCVTGDTSTFVDAGAGDDVVDGSGANSVNGVLGDGDDTFRGSAAVDSVWAGSQDGSDAGRDVIDAGPRGEDFDIVRSGQSGSPNPDRITGEWLTLRWAGTPTSDSAAVGSTDSLFVMADQALGRIAIDSNAGTFTPGSSPSLDLSGFTSFSVAIRGRNLEQLTFRGSNRDETLFVPNAPKSVVRVAMGGGDDELTVGTYGKGSSFSGGDGRDYLDVLAPAHLDLDLRGETLTRGRGKKARTFEANSFEDAFLRANTARLIGTGRPNRLSTDACRTRIEGLGGNDRINGFNDTGFDRAGRKCTGQDSVSARVLGGPGNDLLRGSAAKDLIIGGPGRDRAKGDLGRDVCQAEVRESCEVVRR